MSVNARLGKALKSLLAEGADFADLYFETSSSHSFVYEEGAFEEISSSSSEGTGARVVRGESTSHVHAPGVGTATGFSCLDRAASNSGLLLPPGMLTEGSETALCG
jgi:TldD protein